MTTTDTATAEDAPPPPRSDTRTVIAASAAGTAFEWYDFFIFGALAPVISRSFTGGDDTAGFIFALGAFAAGFGVRPLGALFFGRYGDRIGRKAAFLATITLMGAATVLIGFLPDYAAIGAAAPVMLVMLRLVQGFALGGEYGGAAIYVAEHADRDKRGASTAWIQGTAAVGLIVALAVILLTRTVLGSMQDAGVVADGAFDRWGWRIPFLASGLLLAVSLWIRMRLEESPAFQKIKAEGKVSKSPFAESFGRWENLRLVLLALVAIMFAQGAVWYAGHFYAQFFLERVLRVPSATVNGLMIAAVVCSAPMYVFFGRLSDKVGRKPVMLFGMILAALLYFPGFHWLTAAANAQLDAAQQRAPVTVAADPADCGALFDPLGRNRYVSGCDVARNALATQGISYETLAGAAGRPAVVRVGEAAVPIRPLRGLSAADAAAGKAANDAAIRSALTAAGYPTAANPGPGDLALVLGVLVLFMVAATALYGPQAAALVELFPTRIRYTALSVPYHIGTGWVGGFLPFTAFAMVAAAGDVYIGLWYPLAFTVISILATLFLLPETRGRDIG